MVDGTSTSSGSAFVAFVVGDSDEVMLRLEGELDLSSAERLAGVVDEARRLTPARITVDLDRLTFCDVAGAKLLLAVAGEAQAAGADCLFLPSRAPSVRQLFGILRLQERLTFHPPPP